MRWLPCSWQTYEDLPCSVKDRIVQEINAEAERRKQERPN